MKYPDLVAVNSKGQVTHNAMDFRGYPYNLVIED